MAAKIKSACVIAAKELSEADGGDKKDKKEQATVEKCLKWAIENVILTPEQQKQQPKHSTPVTEAPATPAPATPAAATPAAVTPAPATEPQPAAGAVAPEAAK